MFTDPEQIAARNGERRMRNGDWEIFKTCVDTAIFPSARPGLARTRERCILFFFLFPSFLPSCPGADVWPGKSCACFSTFNLPVCRRSTAGDIGEWKNIRALAHTRMHAHENIRSGIWILDSWTTMTRSFYDSTEKE